jgi:hypothetical protein
MGQCGRQPSIRAPAALHVIIAHDLDVLEQKIIEAELAGGATPASPRDLA